MFTESLKISMLKPSCEKKKEKKEKGMKQLFLSIGTCLSTNFSLNIEPKPSI